ncbi:MAG: ribonuclease E activity regulator RraA [Deinococcota bacterium]
MFQTADLCDAHDVQVCAPLFRNFGGRASFSGPIATVQLYEDNVLYLEALESVPAGTVIVVDGGGSTRVAIMGDRLGKIATTRGIPGVILNAAVRDTVELSKLDVGVLALAPCPKKSFKRGEGTRDSILGFGGVIWRPGEYVYADEDGVIVSQDKLV